MPLFNFLLPPDPPIQCWCPGVSFLGVAQKCCFGFWPEFLASQLWGLGAVPSAPKRHLFPATQDLSTVAWPYLSRAQGPPCRTQTERGLPWSELGPGFVTGRSRGIGAPLLVGTASAIMEISVCRNCFRIGFSHRSLLAFDSMAAKTTQKR